MSNKNFFLSNLIILILIVTTHYITHNYSRKVESQYPLGIKVSAHQSIPQAYNAWLVQEESVLWKEVTKNKHSNEYCDQLKKQWYEDYKLGELDLQKKDTAQQTISPELQNRINTILSDFGLSIQKIPIVAWKENSAAAATDYILFVNEKEFSKLPYEAQKFVIGHEVQHFLYKDCSTNYVLKRYYNVAQQALAKDHPINKFSRFQELRADIKSALTGPDYAKGYVQFIEILSKKRENKGITHPKNSLRLSMGKTLIGNFV